MSSRLGLLIACVPGIASAHTLGVASASWDAIIIGWTLPFESAVLVTWMAVIGVLLAYFSRQRSVFHWAGLLFVGLGIGLLGGQYVVLSEPLALALLAMLALWVTVFYGLSPVAFCIIIVVAGFIAGSLTQQSHPELLTVWSVQIAAIAALIMAPMMVASALRLPGDRFPRFGEVLIRVVGSWMVALAAMQSAFLIQA